MFLAPPSGRRRLQGPAMEDVPRFLRSRAPSSVSSSRETFRPSSVALWILAAADGLPVHL